MLLALRPLYEPEGGVEPSEPALMYPLAGATQPYPLAGQTQQYPLAGQVQG